MIYFHCKYTSVLMRYGKSMRIYLYMVLSKPVPFHAVVSPAVSCQSSDSNTVGFQGTMKHKYKHKLNTHFLSNETPKNEFCVSVHHSISQMKHQLDATLCRFNFCRVTLHVSGASAQHQEYLKLVQRPLAHVFCKNI